MTPRLPWPSSRLEEVAQVQTGLAKGKYVEEGKGVPIPYLRVANVQDGYVDLTELKSIVVEPHALQRYSLRDGDVLFTEGGDADKLGRGCVWRAQVDPCLHQNHIFAVRASRDVLLPSFLAAYAAGPVGKNYFLNCAKQTTNLASINSTQLKSLPVPIPPLGEQRKIAAILSSVDDAIESTQAVIDQLQVVKKAMMAELLTRGLPGRHTRFKKTEIGEVPEEWEIAELDELLDAIDAGWSPQCEGEPAAPNQWGVLKVSAVSSGLFVPTENKALPKDLSPRPSIEVKPGDVLLARASGVLELVGVTVLVRDAPSKLMLSDKILRLRPNGLRLQPGFLAMAMQMPDVREQLLTATGGSHMRNVSQAALHRLRLAVPPLAEQESITGCIGSFDDRLMVERASLVALAESKSALLSALLTGELRVTPDEALP